MSDSRYEYTGSPQPPVLVGRRSRTPWEDAITHRATVMRILPGSSTEGRRGTICVLGAGQCHDIDLVELLGRHHEVHLVDQDSQAMRAGIDEQRVSGNVRIHFHGGIDIGEVDSILAEHASGEGEVVTAPAGSSSAVAPLTRLGEFDVVYSANVLPELMQSATRSLGAEHPALPAVHAAIRERHVDLLLDLAREGGQIVLAMELVNSAQLPVLSRTGGANLEELLGQPGIARVFHPGCNPALLDQLLSEPNRFTARMSRYDVSKLWLRQQGNECAVYLTFALTRRCE